VLLTLVYHNHRFPRRGQCLSFQTETLTGLVRSRKLAASAGAPSQPGPGEIKRFA